MDSTELRLILLFAGVALVAGIYFWDRMRRVSIRMPSRRQMRRRKPPLDRQEPQLDDAALDKPQQAELAGLESSAPEPAEDQLHELSRQLGRDVENSDQQVEELSFSAREPDVEAGLGDDLPQKILQLNLIAKAEWFSGEQLKQVLAGMDIEPGAMDIFHRLDEKTGRPVFSVASMVEPGSFPFDSLAGFKTPGVVFFAQLPGPKDCLAVYSDMLFTAERIAALLDGELQDETHSVLTKQAVDHTRDELLEYRRQLHLALARK